ncbi:MAG: ECF-type sigma factor [Verrucomicrobiota bacterium]
MEELSPDPPTTLDEMSSDQLLPIVYDELRRLAAGRILKEMGGMTLQPTALVHEAWIRLGGKFSRNWASRDHFFNAAALTMRRILMDRAKQKASVKYGGARQELAPPPESLDEIADDERLLLIDEALHQLERESPEEAKIVILKFFGGLTNQEIAETQGLNVRTIERKWSYSKIRLFQIVREIETKT